MTNVPVMICAFNRPDTLKKVIESVSLVKPQRLYLVLDAPRSGNENDIEGVAACKEIFERSIDWECEIYRNYAEKNMGCGKRMTSGISWVFEHEDRAIILEDDCISHPSFFRFCEELLERYKDDMRVGMIAAECEHFRKAEIDFHGDSYYFDRMSTIGAGWATWRRAWKMHDSTLPFLERMIETGVMYSVLKRQAYVDKWAKNARLIKEGRQKTWAGAWATTLYRGNMLVAHSVVNPAINIGQNFSSRMGAEGDVFCSPVEVNKIAEEIVFPLQHPVSMIPNAECERFFLEDMLYMSIWRKVASNPSLALKRFWRRICG
ncbi:MAG: glycosyltransferase family A protein [Kiritimatiellia bacterium]